MHTGPYSGVAAAHAALQEWAREHGITLDGRDTDRGRARRGLVERYLVDAAAEPDSSKWEVELAYLTAARGEG